MDLRELDEEAIEQKKFYSVLVYPLEKKNFFKPKCLFTLSRGNQYEGSGGPHD